MSTINFIAVTSMLIRGFLNEQVFILQFTLHI